MSTARLQASSQTSSGYGVFAPSISLAIRLPTAPGLPADSTSRLHRSSGFVT